MRGNESNVNAIVDAIHDELLIPMRGNEKRITADYTFHYRVTDPHEG